MFQLHAVHQTFASRSRAVKALKNVDFSVPEGQLTAVLGPSGCGKTTLLRVMAGFLVPDSGEVRLGDRVVAAPGVFVRPEERRIGIVAQEGGLFPHLSVGANVAYGLSPRWQDRLSLRGRHRHRDRVERMLEFVGLGGHADRRPQELSGGQQQRVALARALAPGPSVILMDEPFSSLDTALRVELREEVRELLRSIEATAVLVTHDQGEALSLADHVAVMRDGCMVQHGRPMDVYCKPTDPLVAASLGDTVEVPCRICSEHLAVAREHCVAGSEFVEVQCPLGNAWVHRSAVFPAPTVADHDDGSGAMPERLVLRPEQLVLSETGVPARVCATSFYGHDSLVRVCLRNGTELLVRTEGQDLPAVGSDVRVRVAPDRRLANARA